MKNNMTLEQRYPSPLQSDDTAQSACNGLLDDKPCKMEFCKWYDCLMTYNCGGEDSSGDPLYSSCEIKVV